MAQAKARSLDDDDDPTWRPLHAESVCAQRREVALCIVPVSPQDWRVVEFGHQEVQNVAVGVLQHKQFSVSGRRIVEGLAELAGARSTEPSRYWCKPRQKSGTAQLLITETRSR